MLSKFWIHELTRPAFEQWLEEEAAPVVIIGIGSVEQHGPHLPLGTDSLVVRRYIHEVARRSNSVCVHPCFPGYSPHHMAFPGTVTFREDTLLAILMDTIGSLANHGIKRFVLMNAHGGNTNIVNLAVQLSRREFRVMVAAPTGPAKTDMAKEFGDRQKRYWDVHSGPTETGAALLLFPEFVEMERLKQWKATLRLPPELMEFLNPDREDYELVSQIYRACAPPDTDQFTSSGIFGTNDPRQADPEENKIWFEERVAFVVKFIELWKSIPLPEAFQD
jgi:creatinine amidohydrolase